MEHGDFTKNKAGYCIKNASGHWSFVPNDLPPKLEVNWKLASLLSDADRKLSELAGTARTLPNPHLLIGPFSRREAVLSSKIEGTLASISDLMSYEALGLVGSEKSDVREVANYVSALEHGLARLKDLPISLRLLREIHQHLMQNVRGESLAPGEFRRIQNWIGPPGCKIEDATFVPPPIHEMKQALSAFEKYIHAPSELPPLVRMALIHYQFEAIHPFIDGNGRVGRLLITLLLCADRLMPEPLLYLSVFFERHRAEYYRLLLEVSQEGNWLGWLSFFLRGVAEQSSDAIARAALLQELATTYRERLQDAHSSATLLKLADHLFLRPFVNTSYVAKAMRVSYPAAQKNIDKLVKEGILEEITGRQRKRIYSARKIMEIVEKENMAQLPIKFGTSSA